MPTQPLPEVPLLGFPRVNFPDKHVVDQHEFNENMEIYRRRWAVLPFEGLFRHYPRSYLCIYKKDEMFSCNSKFKELPGREEALHQKQAVPQSRCSSSYFNHLCLSVRGVATVLLKQKKIAASLNLISGLGATGNLTANRKCHITETLHSKYFPREILVLASFKDPTFRVMCSYGLITD